MSSEFITSILSENSVTASLLIFIVLGMLWVAKKIVDFIPEAVRSHFRAINEMNDASKANMDKVVQSFKEGLKELFQQNREHNTKLYEQNAKIFEKLNDITNTQDKHGQLIEAIHKRVYEREKS